MKKYILFAFFILFSLSYGQIFYDLKVNITPKNGEIEAIAHIYSDKTENIKLDTGNLDVYVAVFGKEKLPVNKKVLSLEISPEKDLLIKYRKKFLDFKSENIITDEAISLVGKWYPLIDKLAVYSLQVEIPEGFTLISEYENLQIKQKGNRIIYNFHFPYPSEGIHIIGSTEYIKSSEKYNGIQIETYLFKKDQYLSKEYIQKAKEYLTFYSRLIGEYPYKRFAVVENFFPTGYSMPTFTLIGQQIINLPFIVEKSLAHEILHQWFGCSVYTKGGNWAEGLTTFLSDYRLSEDKKIYRKNTILKFLPFSDGDYPLSQFAGKSDLKSEAIGYGKSMMIFLMLSDLIGEENFYKSLSEFYRSFKFKRASWKDIENVFSTVYSQSLDWFFDQWVYKNGIPEINVSKIDHFLKDDGFHIRLMIELNRPYRLKIPVTVKTYLRNIKKYIWVDKKINDIEIVVKDEPLNILIDPEYRIFRDLSWKEVNPVLYFILFRKDLVIYAPENSLEYVPFTKFFSTEKLFYPEEFSYSQIYNKNVIILGSDNPVLQKIFGKRFPRGNYVDIYKNPFGDKNVIAIFSSDGINQSKIMIRKIRHYGSYSKLIFENKKIIKKEIKNYQDGIKFQIRQRAEIVSKSGIKSFKDIVNDALKKQIIYIGEQHILFSDHAMELNIIKAVHKKYPEIAVAMEMFQRSKQNILDQFIQGEIDEKEFLRKSDYYNSWRFNYHLYRPILLYCRKNKIPVVALNTDRKIIDKISKKGLESLTEEERKQLPSKIDFTDVDYIDFIRDIFFQHKGKRKFINFLQSQIVWDETMAETVSKYLQKNPERKIIVIAGSGHIRFRYGIPSRVERRTGKRGLSVVLDDQLKENIADYIVYTAHLEGEKEKKIGVVVEETDKGLKVEKVSKNSPGEKAGIKPGDIIIAFNGKPVKTVADLRIELYFSPEENSVTVLRNGKKIELNISFK